MANNKHLAIGCAVERLWPAYTNSTKGTWFGLNLFVAYTDQGDDDTFDPAIDLAPLRTWNWSPIQQVIVVATMPGGGGTVIVKTATVNLQVPSAPASWTVDATTLTDPTPVTAALPDGSKPPRGILERELMRLVSLGSLKSFLWDPLKIPGDEPDAHNLYRNLLAHTSTLPAPLPSKLNLTVYFQLDASNADQKAILDLLADTSIDPGDKRPNVRLFAAPVVTMTASLSFKPKPDVPEQIGATRHSLHRWADAGTSTVRAYTLPCDHAQPQVKTTYFNLDDYWIRAKPDGTPETPPDSRDWHATLETRAAQGWNLARRLIDAARLDSADSAKWAFYVANWRAFRQSVVSALRDLAGAGTIDSPDGSGLLRSASADAIPRQSRSYHPRIVQAWSRAFRARVTAWEQAAMTYDGWLTLLPAVLPDLNNGDVMRAVLSTPVLRLLSWGDGSGVPNSGKNLVVIGTDNNDLFRIRTFDASGNLVKETDETRLPSTQAGAIATLKQQLPGLLPPHVLTVAEKDNVLKELTSILGQPLPSEGDPPAGGEKEQLNALDRLEAQLAREDVLNQLVAAQWTRAVDETGPNPGQANGLNPGSIDPRLAGGTTSPFFYERFALSKQAPNDPTKAATGGTLDLGDGDAWVLTLGNLFWSTDADGKPSGGSLEVTLRDGGSQGASNTNSIRWKLQLVAGASDSQLKAGLSFPTSGAADVSFRDVGLGLPVDKLKGLHVRLRLQRVPDQAKTFRISAQWSTVAETSGQPLDFRSHNFEDASTAGKTEWAVAVGLDLNQVGIAVSNTSASGIHLAGAMPSVLAVPREQALSNPIIDSWDADPRLDKAARFWDLFSGTIIGQVLPSYQLRNRLALGHFARTWPSLLNGMKNPPKEIPDRYQAELVQAFHQRLGNQSASGSRYPDYMPPPKTLISNANLVAAIDSRIKAFAVDYARTVLLPALNDAADDYGEDRRPTETAHPLVLQLDHADAYVENALGDDDDFLRRVAGFGVLMRQAAVPKTGDTAPVFQNQSWRCLNMCRMLALTNPGAQADKQYEVALSVAVVPKRIIYRNSVRQATARYENHPIVARSPVQQFADLQNASLYRPDDYTSASDVSNIEALLTYESMDITATDYGDYARLPALKFGQWYQLRPLLIGNSGALPADVADGHPSIIRKYGDLSIEPTATDPYVRTAQYVRRVRIGVPRNFQLDVKQPSVPPFPSTVTPLCRELAVMAVTDAVRSAAFYFDEITGNGGLTFGPGEAWTIVLPRLGRPGVDASTQQTFNAEIHIESFKGGVVALGASGPLVTTLAIARNGLKLTITLNGAGASGTTGQFSPLLDESGACDVQLAYDPGTKKVTVWGRTSDIGADWTAAANQPAGPSTKLENARVVVWFADQPTGVAPAATSLSFSPPQVTLSGVLMDPPTTTDVPVLLLGPAGQPFTTRSQVFHLRPPATDLLTWDRWFAMRQWLADAPTQKAMAQNRQDIWAAYHRNLLPIGQSQETPNPNDVSFDDPAVTALVVELVPLLVDESVVATERILVSLPNPRPTNPSDPDLIQPIGGAQSPLFNGIPLVDLKALALNVINATAPPSSGRRINDGVAGQDTDPTTGIPAISPKTSTAIDRRLLEITVLEREIWELRVYPGVEARHFDSKSTVPDRARLASFLMNDRPVVRPAAGVPAVDPLQVADTDLVLFSPLRVLVEAATDVVVAVTKDDSGKPTQDAHGLLYDALLPFFDGTRVKVTFEKPLLKNPDGSLKKPDSTRRTARTFRYVGQVELSRQVWRWQGRPVAPFPYVTALPPLQPTAGDPSGRIGAADLRDVFPPSAAKPNWEPLPMLWDAEGFAGRSNLDLFTQFKAFSIADANPVLFTEDLSNDPRALYYRFSVRAFGRYNDLIPRDPPSLTTLRVRPDVKGDGTAWRRLLVPSRWSGAVPKPLVRLIVPLTQSATAEATTAGLLVVIDQPWYAEAGLAEALEAEVVTVPYPSSQMQPLPAGMPPIWPEFGPDPILTSKGWGELPGSTPTTPKLLPIQPRLECLGLIGHTFDTDADAPRYVASSAVLPAPGVDPVTETNPPNPQNGLGWYFAKIRLRRTFYPEAAAGYPPASNTFTPPASQATLIADLELADAWAVTIEGLATPDATTTGTLLAAISLNLGSNPTAPWAEIKVDFEGTNGTVTFTSGPHDPPASPIVCGDVDDRPVRFDLRFVLRRDDGPSGSNAPAGSDGANKPVFWHVASYVRIAALPATAQDHRQPNLGVWRPLVHRVRAYTPDPAHPADRPKIAFDFTPVGTVNSDSRLTYVPAQVSPFTQSYWTQFLPDAVGLLPRKKVEKVVLKWDTPSDPKDPSTYLTGFTVTDSETGKPDWQLAAPTARKDAKEGVNRFYHQAVVTRLVADVSGHMSQERYLGLYAPEFDASGNFTGHFARIHPKPTTRTILTGSLTSQIAESGLSSYRVRIIELQARLAKDTPAATLDKITNHPWDALFGDPSSEPSDFTHRPDALTRVVRISEPADLPNAKRGVVGRNDFT